MDSYLTLISQELGIATWMIIVILAWTAVWKILALWKSARNNSPVWFILLILINTVGILEILYIFVFSKMKFPKLKIKAKKRKKKKK
jgi:methionyl-tRNA synthetase